jgi:hypothetical protein
MTFPTFEEFIEWVTTTKAFNSSTHPAERTKIVFDYLAKAHQEELSIQRSVNVGLNKIFISCNRERNELKDRIEKILVHNTKLIQHNSTLIKLLDKTIEAIEPYDDLSELRNEIIIEKEQILEGTKKGEKK